MEFLLFILSFLVAYIVGGRKIAIPYGVAVMGNPWLTILLTLILDLIQIPLFYFIYSESNKKIKMLRKVRARGKKEMKESKVARWAKKFGVAGVFVLSMLPSFGGGIWTAVLLAFILKIDRKISYAIIAIGSLIGITLTGLLSHGIIQSIINFIS